MSFFRQLTTGIKFDKTKFRPEAEKFGLVKKETKAEDNTENVSLDDDFVPDSNMPTPEDSEDSTPSSESSDEERELRLLGNPI